MKNESNMIESASARDAIKQIISDYKVIDP